MLQELCNEECRQGFYEYMVAVGYKLAFGLIWMGCVRDCLWASAVVWLPRRARGGAIVCEGEGFFYDGDGEYGRERKRSQS